MSKAKKIRRLEVENRSLQERIFELEAHFSAMEHTVDMLQEMVQHLSERPTPEPPFLEVSGGSWHRLFK